MNRPYRNRLVTLYSLGILGLAGILPASGQTASSPVISANGILNAADYTQQIAPGGMVAIFGANLAPQTTIASGIPMPKSLEGVSVEILESGKTTWTATPLYFVSQGQINIQFPFVASTSVQVRVSSPNGVSPAMAVTLVPRAPRIFTRTADGKGEPTLFHSRDFSWITAAAPAVPGEYVALLLTGLGAVSPSREAGSPGGDNGVNGALNVVTDTVTVSFGGLTVPTLFAGLMPGFSGVYQVNFQVPDAIPTGAQALQVLVGSSISQANVAAFSARYDPGAVILVVPVSGGTLSTAGAAVTLPAGLFAEPTTVSISKPAIQTTPVDKWKASDVYTLRGLPSVLNLPVPITLDLTSKQALGETLVAINPGPGVRGSGLQFLESSVADSKATVILPSAATGGSGALGAPSALVEHSGKLTLAAESGPEVSLYVMTFYSRMTVGDFTLFYPADLVQGADVNSLGNTLNQAKTQLSSLGLSWDRRTRWPLRVVIYPFTGADSEKWGMAEASMLGLNYGSISINASKLSGGLTADLKATLGHELFHVLQNLYDPRDAIRIAKSPGSWLWYQEAASTWFESRAIGDRNNVPAIVQQDNYSFLSKHGLEYQPGDASAVQNHGYGASMFLQFLADHAGGDSVVGTILKDGLLRSQGILADSARWPAEAAASVLTGMLPEYWRNFVAGYVEGSIYGGGFPGHGEVLGQMKDKIVFVNESTPGKTFSWDAPSLSAAFYVATFQAWPKDTRLTISLNDPGGEAQLSIYRVHGASWTLVTRTRAGTYEFLKPEDLVTNGESLLLVAANANGSGRYITSTPIAITLAKVASGVTSYERSFHAILYNQYYELDLDVKVDGTVPFKVGDALVATGCCMYYSVFSANLITPAIDLTQPAGKDQVDEFTVTVTYSNLKKGSGAPGGWRDGMSVKAGFDVSTAMVPGQPTMSKTYKVTRGGKALTSTFLTQLLWPDGVLTLGGTDSPATITFSPSK